MTATKDFCRLQVARLRVAPLFAPTTERAAKDWLDTLMRHCQSNEHAESVMTKFLETVTEAQNPLAAAVAIARDSWRHDQPPPGCRVCELGPDENTGEMRWASHIGADRDEYTYAVRCNCSRGQWFRDKDRERLKGGPPEKKSSKMASVRDTAKLAAGDKE